ncbi:MAG: hypothetical protein COB42_06715 [Sulfurimonas sp.]|nr:MAG: hypothetical protein COB42_06715 [Sulfurimonas sp.]
MAKIKYLINNKPRESMLIAIKAENIMYGSFYARFKECWGRFSTRIFTGIWNDNLAKRYEDGVAVFGKERIKLFSDASVNYKYTKLFCKVIGSDYDTLLSQKGDVDYFYMDLKGVKTNLDFTSSVVVENAMRNIKQILEPYGIDSVSLSFIADSEFDTPLMNIIQTDGLTLENIRLFFPHLNYGTAEYLEDFLVPTLSYTGLPTSLEIVDGESTRYQKVDGAKVVVSENDVNLALLSFLKNTSYLDACFDSIDFTATPLESREEGVGIYGLSFEQTRYTINFNFNSTISTIDGSLVDEIDWSHLVSDTLATSFSTNFSTQKEWYELARRRHNYSSFGDYSLDEQPEEQLIVLTSIVSFLDDFSDVSGIFYNRLLFSDAPSYLKPRPSFLRFERLKGISNKEFSNLLMMSVHIGYQAKKKSGWFGGGWFGKILEMVFIIVVVVVSIILSIAFWNPYPLMVGMALLFIAAKYTGMSSFGQRIAGVGMQILSIVAVVMGVYNIYDMALQVAAEEAATTMLVQGMEEAAVEAAVETLVAEGSLSFAASGMTLSSSVELMTSFYSAFNLMMPKDDKVAEDSEVESQTQDNHTAIYNLNMASDFYDEIYNVYN